MVKGSEKGFNGPGKYHLGLDKFLAVDEACVAVSDLLLSEVDLLHFAWHYPIAEANDYPNAGANGPNSFEGPKYVFLFKREILCWFNIVSCFSFEHWNRFKGNVAKTGVNGLFHEHVCHLELNLFSEIVSIRIDNLFVLFH